MLHIILLYISSLVAATVIILTSERVINFIHLRYIDRTIYMYGSADSPLSFSFKGKSMLIYCDTDRHDIQTRYNIVINGNVIVSLYTQENRFMTTRVIILNSDCDTTDIWRILAAARRGYRKKVVAQLSKDSKKEI